MKWSEGETHTGPVLTSLFAFLLLVLFCLTVGERLSDGAISASPDQAVVVSLESIAVPDDLP